MDTASDYTYRKQHAIDKNVQIPKATSGKSGITADDTVKSNDFFQIKIILILLRLQMNDPGEEMEMLMKITHK